MMEEPNNWKVIILAAGDKAIGITPTSMWTP